MIVAIFVRDILLNPEIRQKMTVFKFDTSFLFETD